MPTAKVKGVAAGQGVTREIIERQLAHFDKADPAYGKAVRAALKL